MKQSTPPPNQPLQPTHNQAPFIFGGHSARLNTGVIPLEF